MSDDDKKVASTDGDGSGTPQVQDTENPPVESAESSIKLDPVREVDAPSEEPSISDAQLAKKKVEETIEDLDDLMEQKASAEESEETSIEDIDAQLKAEAPELEAELADIQKGDFSEVNDSDGKPSKAARIQGILGGIGRIVSFRFLKGMPKAQKVKLFSILLLVVGAIPLFYLAATDRLLPKYRTPYYLNFGELTKDVVTYDVSASLIPLFDSLRSNAVTVVLPQTVINMKSVKGSSSFGRFTFSVSVRDKEFATLVEQQRSSIMDMIQRTLEEVSWEDIQNPLGKEKVKKIIRYKLNQFFQGDVVLGVYYESIILTR